MEELLAEAYRIAQTEVSVLILGESGTGKELLAAAIHKASARRDGAFVAINCGAIPEQLLESELFGHTKGAFTGATSDRVGLIQAANGGTVFLDEIGDMQLPLQVKLLRVLQERKVRPLGSTRDVPINVRVISATHGDLRAAMARGDFREDLFYRLNVVQLQVPRLADRREDIPALVGAFLRRIAERDNTRPKVYAPEAMELLVTADWPGNVRQLANIVEQNVALSPAPVISVRLVQKALGRTPGGCPRSPRPVTSSSAPIWCSFFRLRAAT
jgi:two-component system response regulator GlrR